jgi:hypothetical protein
MPQTPNLRLLGMLMVLGGLAVTIGLAFWVRQIPHMTDMLSLLVRAQFLGAAATTLGGAWLQWFAGGRREPGAFPVLQGL